MQVSARYGFGEDINTLSDEDAAKAKMWEMISLTVAFIASMSVYPLQDKQAQCLSIADSVFFFLSLLFPHRRC